MKVNVAILFSPPFLLHDVMRMLKVLSSFTNIVSFLGIYDARRYNGHDSCRQSPTMKFSIHT
jgi:hypothetical protein